MPDPWLPVLENDIKYKTAGHAKAFGCIILKIDKLNFICYI